MSAAGALKWMLAVTLALLVASLCINLLLGRSLLLAFERLQFARIFPLGYVADDEKAHALASRGGAPAQDAVAPSTDVPRTRETIAFWGDSRAYLWDTTALARDRAIENFGHGAVSSAQLLLQLKTMPLTHSTYSVVQIGINDLHPLGVLQARKDEIVAGLQANMVAIRDALLARSERVVLSTIIPPGPVPLERRLTWDTQTLALIEVTNRVIDELADGQRVVVLDAHSLLRDEQGWLAPQYADSDFFLHVNQAAYARLNSELNALLTVQAYSK
jgi:hypothetical protein